MFRPSAFLVAGAALMAAGTAHAQERPEASATTEAVEARAAMPWYQRFTTSNGLTESIIGNPENDRLLPPAWTLNQRWGVTVDVREAQRLESVEGGRGDQTAVGAYYQFTPRVRVGGELSVETGERPGPAPAAPQEPRAGVRIESAFRF